MGLLEGRRLDGVVWTMLDRGRLGRRDLEGELELRRGE